MASNDHSPDTKTHRSKEPRFTLNISPSSHASDTTYSAPDSFSRDASSTSFFPTPSREQRTQASGDLPSWRGSPPSQRWLLSVSHDSERVDETPSRIRKYRQSSVMSNSFHEEKAGVFSPCIEVGENLTACYENEEEEEEGTASPPTQEIPPDANESVKPVDYSEETEEVPSWEGDVSGTPKTDEVQDVVKSLTGARGNVDTTLLVAASKNGSDETFESVLNAIREKLSAQEVSSLLSSALHAATTESLRDEKALSTISTLLQHGAVPSTEDLIFLVRVFDVETLDDCFFQAMVSAKNSFVPGMNLALKISTALDEAQKMERNKLLHLRYEIDKIQAEVLRWLPETVRELSGGMYACAALLEPEAQNARATSMQGPLSLALHCGTRIVTFATSPLGMDYIFQKFTRGLPGLFDVNYTRMVESPHLDPREEAMGHESLTALSGNCWFGSLLMGTAKLLSTDSMCTLAVFPGGHFITTGIIALPNAYYKVPAVRMAFDFIVFVGVLVVFVCEVLLEDDGSVESGEIAFAVIVTSALIKEVMELRKSMDQYMMDNWHKLGLFALQICIVAFIVRVVDPKSSWGPGLYALAAPLLFWRILYFAQVFSFQGAMIQVIYMMATVLLQFGIVIGTVLLGFAVAFYSLFRELEGLTLSSALLDVFKAMLGEVGFFDNFAGTPYYTVATLLLVVYLVIMAIMLLNLLIAVLSTAHSNVEEGVLLRVANARVLMFYRRVVDVDILPEPFNLIQMLFKLPFAVVDLVLGTKTHIFANKLVGRLMFWMIMGPVAILGGWVFWLLSLPKAVSAIWGAQTSQNNGIISTFIRILLCVVLIVVGVPIVWTLFWLAQAQTVITGRTVSLEAIRPPADFAKSVDELLREASGGMGMEKLREIIADPVKKSNICNSKPEWEDQATTLRHVKALGERLETITEERIVKLKADLGDKVASITEEKIGRLEAKLDRLMSAMVSEKEVVL